jgi:hypothetical protein
MTSTALRIYTAAIALICGAAIAWSIHQSAAAGAWRTDAVAWQGLVQKAVAREHQAAVGMRRMVIRYNGLVRRTRRSQQRLLATAGAAAPVATPTAAGTFAAPIATAPVPVAVSAPAPTTTHVS